MLATYLCTMYIYMICDISGWSNPPENPTLNITELNETVVFCDHPSMKYFSTSVNVKVTWSPPHYLGGLHTSDIYYQLNTNGHDINTTDNYSLLFYDKINFHSSKKILDISVIVHYNGSTVDTLYTPSNVLVKKTYGNLLCNVIGE